MSVPALVWSAVLSSGITATALVIQAQLNNNREVRRLEHERRERRKDRRFARTAATTTRTDALQDHWRDERFAAHTAFMSAIDRARNDWLGIQYDWMDPKDRTLSPASEEGVESAWSTVQLLGSEDSQAAGALLMEMFGNMRIHAWAMQEELSPNDAEVTKKRLKALQEAYDEYRRAARRDVGTET